MIAGGTHNERQRMKTQKEIDDEVNLMSIKDKKLVKAYEGIPTGAAVALHREIQEIKKSNSELKESVNNTMNNVLMLLGEIRGELKENKNKIEKLECNDKQIESRINIFSTKVGVAI